MIFILDFFKANWWLVVKIIVVLVVVYKLVFFLISQKRNSINFLSKDEYENIRKRIKIAVVENQMNTFPVKELQDDLFAITPIRKVKQPELNAFESGAYEIIILDIKDIVDSRLINNDGLGLLERIKKISPETYVVVCTGANFDAEEHKILMKADDIMKKPAVYSDIKDKLDAIIRNKFIYKNEINKIKKIIQKRVPADKRDRVIELFEASCNNTLNSFELKHNLESLKLTTSCIKDIIDAVEKIITLGS